MINYELDGKVAVVTGGGSRIGLACCHALARSGAAVSVWDLNPEALETAVAELEQYGRPIPTAVVGARRRQRACERRRARLHHDAAAGGEPGPACDRFLGQ